MQHLDPVRATRGGARRRSGTSAARDGRRRTAGKAPARRPCSAPPRTRRGGAAGSRRRPRAEVARVRIQRSEGEQPDRCHDAERRRAQPFDNSLKQALRSGLLGEILVPRNQGREQPHGLAALACLTERGGVVIRDVRIGRDSARRLPQQHQPLLRVAAGDENPAERVGGLRVRQQHDRPSERSARARAISLLLIDPGEIVERDGVPRALADGFLQTGEGLVELARRDVEGRRAPATRRHRRDLCDPAPQRVGRLVRMAGARQRVGLAHRKRLRGRGARSAAS